MDYRIILIVVTICIFIAYINALYEKNRYFWLSGFLLSVLVAFRTEQVPDTDIYLGVYNSIVVGDLSSLSSYSFEPGFQIYTHCLKGICAGNTILYLFCISMTNIALLYFSAKNFNYLEGKNNLSLFLILYYAFFGFFYNAIVLRAGIALSLLLLGISMMYNTEISSNRKKIAVFVIGGISASFHLTAVCGLISYLIFRNSKRLTLTSYLLYWIICLAIFISRISVIIVRSLIDVVLNIFDMLGDTDYSKYSYYIEDLYNLNTALPYRIIFQFVIGLFFISKRNMSVSYYRILNIYMIGLLLSSIFYSIEQISRITDYYLIFSVPLLYLFFVRKMFNRYYFMPLLFIIFIQVFFFVRIINK